MLTATLIVSTVTLFILLAALAALGYRRFVLPWLAHWRTPPFSVDQFVVR